jgi:5-(carboxyamino)imidazole ribonucleotide synthase
LLGAEGFNGPTKYDGIHECLAVNGASVHLYGKQTTKSFRKMGHATVLDKTRNNATFKAQKIKQLLKIYSK